MALPCHQLLKIHNHQLATHRGHVQLKRAITHQLAPGTKPQGMGTMTRPIHATSAHPDRDPPRDDSSQYQTQARSPRIYVFPYASDTRIPRAEAFGCGMQGPEHTLGAPAAMVHICLSRHILGTGCRCEDRAGNQEGLMHWQSRPATVGSIGKGSEREKILKRLTHG